MTDKNPNAMDERLNSPEQEAIRRMVQAAPGDMPSMAWRAELNSKLQRHAKQARSRLVFSWASAAVTVGAGALLLMVMFKDEPSNLDQSQPQTIARAGVEELMISAHFDAVETNSIDPAWPAN